MARKAAPFTIYPDPRTGLAWINARINGERFRKPVRLPFDCPPDAGREEHERRVAEAAAQVYADLIHGRSLAPTPTARVQTSATLHELLALFLAHDAKVYPASPTTTVTHCSHFEAFADDDFRGFGNADSTPKWRGDGRTPLERLTSDSATTDYVRERLRCVLKKTVTKEVTTLFRFFAWAKDPTHGHLASLPPRPEYPRKAIGVRAGPQRAKSVDCTHAEMLRIIAALPVWTAKGGRRRGVGGAPDRAIFARDLGRFSYETGLRPSTIARIKEGVHYSAGARRMWITPDIDKGRNEARWVQLTTAAFDIINRHAKRARALGTATIFGKHDIRVQWKRAAAKVLPPDQAKDFAPYDFRHGGARRFVEVSGGNLLGTAHQLGQIHLTTTNKYLKPAERHGNEVVAAMDAASSTRRKRRPKKRAA